jgi:hypothetical protein
MGTERNQLGILGFFFLALLILFFVCSNVLPRPRGEKVKEDRGWEVCVMRFFSKVSRAIQGRVAFGDALDRVGVC